MAEERTALGWFSVGELQAGGINRRGVLQPLLAAPSPGADRAELARRGLLVRDPIAPDGWRAAGALAEVMDLAAVARTVLAVEGTWRLPWLALHRAGVAARALDLRPDGDGYRCSTGPGEELWPALSATLAASITGAAPMADPADPVEVVTALAAGTSVWHAQALSVLRPDQPPLQHDLRLVDTSVGRWLQLGARHGDQAGSWAAPASPERLRRIVGAMARAEVVEL